VIETALRLGRIACSEREGRPTGVQPSRSSNVRSRAQLEGGKSVEGIVQIVVIVLIVLFVVGYFGRGRFRV
jgi:hypothetical protein